jgi:hypothetical protein
MMNILKFVSTSLLLFVALTGVAQAKEGAVAAKEGAVAAKEAALAATGNRAIHI